MNEKPATTKDITRNIIPAVEEIAEAVGVIAHALVKHSPDPDALVDDLVLISDVDKGHSPFTALFFRRFNLVMRGGIKPDEH
jgi:hypothetical protein